jgi:hypothetical protein
MIDVSGHVHAAWGMCYGLTEPTMTFDQHIAAFALGRVRTSDLPIVAVEALDEGYDCIELAMLAGSTPTEQSWSEAEELWRRALRRLNKAVPGRAEAGRVLRQYYAGLVSSGSLAPRTAAAEIVRLTNDLSDVFPNREYVGDGFGVARLLGLYYSHDDVPYGDERAHDEIDNEITAECKRLMNEGAG